MNQRQTVRLLWWSCGLLEFICGYLSFRNYECDSLFFSPILSHKVLINKTEVTKKRTLDSSELNWAEVRAKPPPKTVEYVSQQNFMCWKNPHCKSLQPWMPALNQQQQLVWGFIWSHSNHLPWYNLLHYTVSTNHWQNILFNCIFCCV